MKVSIRTNGWPRRLLFFLPLCLIKSKIAAKAILTGSNDDDYEPSKEEIEKLRDDLRSSYKSLKRYIRENGHFNLVEVESSEGERVIIRL